jgi:Cu(I)/Ag(I) efflux system membrane protein CusA/SilA
VGAVDVGLVFVAATAFPSAAPAPDTASKVPTVDDLLNLKTLGNVQVSPDGKWVAYSVTSTDWKQDAFVTQIWVAEVASVGGFVRQYQIDVDPARLVAYGIAIGDVMDAVRASNEESGGQSLELAGHEYVIRARGYVRGVDDLRRIPLRAGAGGVPVRLGDVASVTLGPEARRGIADLDGRGEVVGGVVVMRAGENALRVIDGVKARLAELRPGLPPSVEVVVTYDRSELIRGAIGTLRHTLVEEMAIVSIVIVGFLLHLRSALIPILTIPIGVLLAFVPMARQGLTANIMSLGGIAVAIGAMVDASIIVVENVHRRLHEWEAAGAPGRREAVIGAAMQEVGPRLFFALPVITVSLVVVIGAEIGRRRVARRLGALAV